MTPSKHPSIFPFLIDLNEDQPQQLFTCNHRHGTPEAASSPSSQSYHNFIDTTLEGGRYYHSESLPLQPQKVIVYIH
uniref:Uncharacterized protein n=1 Tax=Rhizophora mucronata TaxID=61149 RepID=A0A2P2JSK0_RHIMU